MQELWNKILNFMTDEAFKISNFSVLWWYVIAAAAAVVIILLIVTIAVAVSKRKKKKKAKLAQNEANQVAESNSTSNNNVTSEEQAFKTIAPDWQPVAQAVDKPEKQTSNVETTEEVSNTSEPIVEEQVKPEPVVEPVKKVEPEVVPAPIKEVKLENIPAPIKEVKPESVPAPIKKVNVESVPAPIKQVKTEPVSAPTKQEAPVAPEVIEEKPVELEPIANQEIEETVVEQVVEEKVAEPIYEEVIQEPVKEEIIEEKPVQVEEEAKQEAVATTAPRALPKKTNKTTKKTAAQIANDIEEKTGTNPRKKAASDKPAVIGKDKLPKKTTKAKKEEPVDTKAPAKASSNVDTEDLPLITTDPNVESFGKFVIIKNDDNSTRPYHFRLLANNGQILFESESYKTKPKSNSIIAFKKVCILENFEIDVDKANNWRYKLYNNAHTVIGVGESYSTKQGCENSVQSVIKFAESARYLEDQSE